MNNLLPVVSRVTVGRGPIAVNLDPFYASFYISVISGGFMGSSGRLSGHKTDTVDTDHDTRHMTDT